MEGDETCNACQTTVGDGMLISGSMWEKNEEGNSCVHSWILIIENSLPNDASDAICARLAVSANPSTNSTTTPSSVSMRDLTFLTFLALDTCILWHPLKSAGDVEVWGGVPVFLEVGCVYDSGSGDMEFQEMKEDL